MTVLRPGVHEVRDGWLVVRRVPPSPLERLVAFEVLAPPGSTDGALFNGAPLPPDGMVRVEHGPHLTSSGWFTPRDTSIEDPSRLLAEERQLVVEFSDAALRDAPSRLLREGDGEPYYQGSRDVIATIHDVKLPWTVLVHGVADPGPIEAVVAAISA